MNNGGSRKQSEHEPNPQLSTRVGAGCECPIEVFRGSLRCFHAAWCGGLTLYVTGLRGVYVAGGQGASLHGEGGVCSEEDVGGVVGLRGMPWGVSCCGWGWVECGGVRECIGGRFGWCREDGGTVYVGSAGGWGWGGTNVCGWVCAGGVGCEVGDAGCWGGGEVVKGGGSGEGWGGVVDGGAGCGGWGVVLVPCFSWLYFGRGDVGWGGVRCGWVSGSGGGVGVLGVGLESELVGGGAVSDAGGGWVDWCGRVGGCGLVLVDAAVWVCEVVIGWGGGLGGVECGGDECCGDGGGRCYFVGCVLGRRLGGRVVVAFVGGYGRWLNLEEYWGFEVGGVVYGEDRVVWMGGLLALGMGEGFGVGWLVIGDV
ncbi:hypothetical protein Tco_1410076 [Tanacetum coccineum]|uniref:Uncharacterized protein n=1 Tax=Tanacetum coccineum TaxID=301880 RepID=A0ABQ5AHM3_9ASTR